jgi:hypothetical protein
MPERRLSSEVHGGQFAARAIHSRRSEQGNTPFSTEAIGLLGGERLFNQLASHPAVETCAELIA